MKTEIAALLESLKAGQTSFAGVLEFINNHYQHQPAAFKNGEAYNQADQNQGSARVFAFAALNGLSAENTLVLFAEHYQSVLANPAGTDHQNIRQFMLHGWDGIVFESDALLAK